MKLFFLQNIQLQQENTELKNKLMGLQKQAEVIQQAVRDRDEAIAKWGIHFATIISL